MIIFIVAALLAGITSGFFSNANALFIAITDSSKYVLLFLLFFIGIGISSNRNFIYLLKQINLKVIFVPIAILMGSFFGGALFGFVNGFSLFESLTIISGMGYYSVSSAIIAQKGMHALAALTFVSNIIREILAILLAPFLARKNKLAPVAAAGATSMDIALPTIIKFTSPETGMISLISGLVITISVPFTTSIFVGLL